MCFTSYHLKGLVSRYLRVLYNSFLNTGYTRPIVLRFANYKDKLSVLEMRKSLKDKHNILLFDDLPKNLNEKQRKLSPVFKALKHLQLSAENATVKDVKLKTGQLVLNGECYNMEELHRLPDEVSLG